MVDAAPAVRSWDKRIAFRFGATLLSNLVRAGLSFFSGLVVARGLGTSEFGDLSFLLGSFAAITQLIESGTSSAFYTFIARRRRSYLFLLFYTGWVALQFGVAAVILAIAMPGWLVGRIWIGQGRDAVLLAFAATFLTNQAWGMVNQLGEAVRRTVLVQTASVLQAFAHLVLVVTADHWGWLSVRTVLWLLVAEYAVLIIVFGPALACANMALSGELEKCWSILREFAGYCKSLVVYGWMGFLYTFADRWLLQEFGGSDQQAFFSVAQQFTNISLIVTTSVLKVFWKEIAEAWEHRDLDRMRALYASTSRGLYAFATWATCLLLPYSREILTWTLGPEYQAGWLCLAIMFLFPVHQSLGQIQGTLLYATGETGPYARLGLALMLVSVPMSYLVLATPGAVIVGLGLGAIGLTIKMVGLQVLGVNLQGFVIARKNDWPFEIGYQAVALGAFAGLALTCRWFAEAAFGSGSALVVILGAGLYLLSSVVLFLQAPQLAGLNRDQLRSILGSLARITWPVVARPNVQQ